MSEKKQSSVEWLVEELNHNIEFIPLAHWDKIRDIVQQAKEMHQEEIIKAVSKGWDYNEEGRVSWMGEQYYKETFGGQDNE